jgi:hypothetical protein
LLQEFQIGGTRLTVEISRKSGYLRTTLTAPARLNWAAIIIAFTDGLSPSGGMTKVVKERQR